MSTDTQAPTIPPKHADYLTKRAEAFERLIIEDEITRTCFVRYGFALLDKLRVRNHRFHEIIHCESEAMPDKDKPTADRAEQLLKTFADAIKERHDRFYAVYQEHFHGQLQRLCCELLSQEAEYDESRELLDKAAKAIPHEVTRPWDNPVRFITDPVTGERSLGDITSSTAMRHITRAQAFLKDSEPASPARKLGRPKGSSKPTGSGEKPSVTQDMYEKAWEAKQGTMKYQSWWLAFARKSNLRTRGQKAAGCPS